MHRYKKLMVCLSRPEADAGLLRYAAMIAKLGTASEVRLVHVLPQGDNASAAAASERVHAETGALFDGPSGPTVVHDVLHGPLIDQVLRYAVDHRVDLLFVDQQPAGRAALARRLAMKAPCSVCVVPDNAPSTVRRILVPVDFSEPAADAMRVATSLARLSGHAECLALHVYFNEAVITYEEYAQVLRGEEQKAYQEFIDRIDCQGVKVRPLFEENVNVPHTIGRVTGHEAVDLIVMATRGRSRSAAILLGSATEEMITDTPVPLLAVKHFGAHLGMLQALLERGARPGGSIHTD